MCIRDRLGIEGRFLAGLSETVIALSRDGYPELEEKKAMIFKVLTEEEDKFNKTIDQGLSILADMEEKMCIRDRFIPKEAALVNFGDGIQAKVRLIDCVGFMVDGAAGHVENDAERLVKTPWFDYEIPFTQAAELGTRCV